MVRHEIRPGTGRGTTRRVVEGLIGPRVGASPSVTPPACHLPVPGRSAK
jgi:hypothetical protein